MTHPKTAVQGNILGSVAMLLAVVVTLAFGGMNYWLILVGLIIGAVIGAIFAVKIQMTAMPQLVALFNGFGGAASFLVAGASLIISTKAGITTSNLIATALSGFDWCRYLLRFINRLPVTAGTQIHQNVRFDNVNN
ncbi:MAG: NAD(P)(+) transhydrogenase (Re/Si-specific) subunit beta [Planctomycetaceae bacterium]